MTTDTVARLKITLDEIKPTILRRVEVPFDIRLDRLHLVIQAALGWTNSHLFEIRARDVGWSIPFPGETADFIDARKARLNHVLEDLGTKTLKYIYDFGDDWEHTIKLERRAAAEPATVYPRLIEAKGRCPPEDVGGPWGYLEFVEAVNDPEHERHKELAEWNGDAGFDPAAVDVDLLTRSVAALAGRWVLGPPAGRRRRSTA